MRRSAPRAFYLTIATNIFAGLVPSALVYVGAQLIAHMTAGNVVGAAVGAATIAVGGPVAALLGAPIFSSGGALGSGSLASPVGPGRH